jgi:4-hydroxybenzoate polyprenyltransferase
MARPVAVLLALMVSGCAIVAGRFVHQPSRRGGRMIESVSGLWTVLMYLSLGAAPLAIAAWRAAEWTRP